eukprot:TRINITY_DN696_c0_g1_i4.p1 TRINITY_DN696_c0_g1~~TRINITY_DN696_c0_g1_i4.p1  ORF type:complete len:476 (-),score=64.97 TRINITY_DN696_c0_g1_i4:55-1482(-)
MSHSANPPSPSPSRMPPAPPAPSPSPQLPRLQRLVSTAMPNTSGSSTLLPKKRSYAPGDWNGSTEAPVSQAFSHASPAATHSRQGVHTGIFDGAAAPQSRQGVQTGIFDSAAASQSQQGVQTGIFDSAAAPQSQQGVQTGVLDRGLLRGGDVLRTSVAVPVRTSSPSPSQLPPPLPPFSSASQGRAQTPIQVTSQQRRTFDDGKPEFCPPRRRLASSDAFIQAAEMGARAQSVLDSSRGRIFDTYHLGKQIIACSKLYSNQRRSNRLLPGGSDSTTAACYMIGGSSDQVLQDLLERLSPCDPREERCKAVERVLKDKTRGAICALNGENPREARADNLAAVRICETIADVLVAYLCRKLIQQRDELVQKIEGLENRFGALREELLMERSRREATERDCWCRGSAEKNHPSATLSAIAAQNVANVTQTHMMDVHSFERNRLLVGRGNLSSSGFRSHASVGHCLADEVETDAQQGAN